MEGILYIDLFFLWNFWMNALILFLVRQLTKTYRTIRCLLAAALGAFFSCFGVLWYIKQNSTPGILLLGSIAVIIMNLLAFGGKNLLWHMFLFVVCAAAVSGVFLYMVTVSGMEKNTGAVIMVSMVSFLFCVLLEKKSRIHWKEEHMKAKTVLEFGDRKMFATALIDTGNKLFDPFYHKPVILVDEKLLREMLELCRREYPEKLHFIPFHSVGRENGLLEGMTLDYVSIKWQNKQMKFREVIAASTKEGLYKGKEYQVVFHCGLLQEG